MRFGPYGTILTASHCGVAKRTRDATQAVVCWRWPRSTMVAAGRMRRGRPPHSRLGAALQRPRTGTGWSMGSPGAPSKLNADHRRALAEVVEAGPAGGRRRALAAQGPGAVALGDVRQLFCRRLAVNPIQNQGNRQHPSRRFPRSVPRRGKVPGWSCPAPRRFLAKLACGLVFARNPYCHQSLPCLDATESDHAARGNPLESNLGAVGITPAFD